MKPMEALALVGRLDEEVTVLGMKFKWRTLDSDEHISSRSAVSLWDAESKEHALKVETLARAIETIDGVSFSSLVKPEEKERPGIVLITARLSISKWQPAVVNRVYETYRRLLVKQDNELEELEKNGKSPITSTIAGK